MSNLMVAKRRMKQQIPQVNYFDIVATGRIIVENNTSKLHTTREGEIRIIAVMTLERLNSRLALREWEATLKEIIVGMIVKEAVVELPIFPLV